MVAVTTLSLPSIIMLRKAVRPKLSSDTGAMYRLAAVAAIMDYAFSFILK